MKNYNSCCIIFVGIVLLAYRINGQLEINMPANNVGNYGETTQLNCTEPNFVAASGYTWYKDGLAIYNSGVSTNGKYTSSHGSGYFTLEITNTAINDNGTYRCSYNFNDKSGTLEIQAKGTAVGKLENGDLKITLTRFYPASTTVSSVVCNGKTFTGTETITANGDLFTIVWTSKNIESNDVKEGCDVNIQSHTTYDIRVDVESPTPAPTPGPKCDLLCILIIIGVLAVVIIGLVIGCCLDWLCRDQRKGCFNCEASDCGECCQCCDNNCVRCKCCGSCCNIKGLPFWYHILWWTVIGTAVSLGIFIRRKLIKQGNGDVEPREANPRHGLQRGNQPRELPPAPLGARSVHDRDPTAIINSDKHPLDDTVTPLQKAGTLKSLHEETVVEVQEKKKKKKKKKLQDDEV